MQSCRCFDLPSAKSVLSDEYNPRNGHDTDNCYDYKINDLLLEHYIVLKVLLKSFKCLSKSNSYHSGRSKCKYSNAAGVTNTSRLLVKFPLMLSIP